MYTIPMYSYTNVSHIMHFFLSYVRIYTYTTADVYESSSSRRISSIFLIKSINFNSLCLFPSTLVYHFPCRNKDATVAKFSLKQKKRAQKVNKRIDKLFFVRF